MKAKYIILISLGVLLAVVGLILAIIHKELALELVGTEQVVYDLFSGGSTFRDVATMFLISGVITLILGSSMLILGLIFGLRQKPKKI